MPANFNDKIFMFLLYEINTKFHKKTRNGSEKQCLYCLIFNCYNGNTKNLLFKWQVNSICHDGLELFLNTESDIMPICTCIYVIVDKDVSEGDIEEKVVKTQLYPKIY